MTDTVAEEEAVVDLETYGPKVERCTRDRRQARAATEKKQGKAAIEAAAQRARRRQDRRRARSSAPPSPAPARRRSRPTSVKVHYTGKLIDGTVFDSSRKRGGQPATFPLNGVIKCWTEGVGRMKVGEQAMLTCPSDIAYGDRGQPAHDPAGRDADLRRRAARDREVSRKGVAAGQGPE